MTFAVVVLSSSAACFAAVIVLIIRKALTLQRSVPALVFFALTVALYAMRIIDGLHGNLDAALYNNLSNGLRLYSLVAFLLTLIIK